MPARPWCAIGAVVVASIAAAAPARADRPSSTSPATHRPLDRAALAARLGASTPRARAAAARVDVAAAEVATAGVRANPALSWEREAVPGRDAHDDFFRLGWSLDLAGQRRRRVAAARALHAAAAAEQAHDGLERALRAHGAYARAAHARQAGEVLARSRADLAALVEVLVARARGGDAADLDAARAGLELALLDELAARAGRERDDAERQLAAALGEDGGLVAVDDLALPAVPADGELDRRDVAAARHRGAAAGHDAGAAARRWVPAVELTAGLVLAGDATATEAGYLLGVRAELPLADAGGAAVRRARAEATAWQAEASALAAEAGTDRGRARARLLAVIAQSQRFDAGPRAGAAALARRMGAAHAGGARDLIDVIDAHRVAREVELQALDLRLEAELARLELHRAEGSAP